MATKAFIFDWSGTLNDNFKMFCKTYNLIFRDFGHAEVSPEEIRKNFILPHMKFWNQYLPDLTLEEELELYEKHIHEVGEPELFPGAKAIVTYLYDKGYKLYILSTDPKSKLLPEIARSGFESLITKVVSDAYNKKEALKQLVTDENIDKDTSFFIGDTNGDVDAGKFVGIKTIGITWGFQDAERLKSFNPDFVIDDLLEIKNIIDKVDR